ncbi:MAG: alpha/beta hydrolase [Fusobacteriaceae bacterium]
MYQSKTKKNSLWKKILLLIVSIPVLIFFITLVRGYIFVNQESELKSWHEIGKLEEPQYKNFKNLEDYFKAEEQFVDKTYIEVSKNEGNEFNRYVKGDISDPYINGKNMNLSYEMIPENIKGGVLILHGLSDSPYITKDIAKIFYDKGFYVLALRYQHHGTHPGEMKKLDWKDFVETAKFGSQMVKKKIENIPDSKFFMAGYSTGAAVSLYYTAEEILKNEDLPKPDKLFWYSPAMGISPAAKFAFLDIWLSKIQYFHKFEWLDILPEYDGGKYNSFPKNAAVQVDKIVTQSKKSALNLVEKTDKKLPPIYAYTSLEDATVNEWDLFQILGKIQNTEGELVIFDANRKFNDFLKKKIRNLEFVDVLKSSKIKGEITVITNYENSRSPEATVYRSKDGKIEIVQTEEPLIWDNFTFSLAHLSIPVSPDNAIYGKNTILGEINIKGERDITLLDTKNFIRLRYNQFFKFLKENMEKNIDN